MKTLFESPYEEGQVQCDRCDSIVRVSRGFNHCSQCEQDICKLCRVSFQFIDRTQSGDYGVASKVDKMMLIKSGQVVA